VEKINLTALGILLDTALGAVTRGHGGPSRRPATVRLEAQFTGASTRRHLVARSRFLGHFTRTPVRQALSSATIMSGGTPVAHASAAMVMLDLPAGVTQLPLPWLRGGLPVTAPLDESSLDAHERQVLARFDRANAAATAEIPVLEHFWCGVPTAAKGKARLTVNVTPHLGNRVGQVHGGVLLGIAARVANAAAAPAMRLSNIAVCFISPGHAPRLKAVSVVIHRGRNLAVVRTQILGAAGNRVLKALSQHASATA
jgi:acyl-coenzyme A thioesterase PaaI-like protein